jgi:formiminotetrahydrofolate cyclodeaminase
MLTDKPLTDLLEAFSSSEPAPGGGSAAALCGALGASLLAMVAALPRTKHGTADDRAALDEARARLVALRNQLTSLVDRDAEAYDAVVAAYRLPKSSDADKAIRTNAVQAALRLATTVPLETLGACSEALTAAQIVAEHGNTSAASDLAVGVQTLLTGIQGAWVNIGINLQSLTDQHVADEIASKTQALREVNATALWHTYEAGGVLELMKKTAARLGPIHAHPASAKEPAPEEFIAPVVEMLGRLGSVEARQAIDALSRSANEEIAGPARAALSRFTSRPDAT